MNASDQLTLLTIEETAARLRVTPSCIRRWVLEQRITTTRIGRLVRIPETEVQRIIEDGLRLATCVEGAD